MKSKLDIFLQSCKCEKSIKQVKVKIDNIEKKVQELSSLRNAKIVENFVQNLKCNGKFSQTGMWKLRKRLHPSKNLDPPMAKMDKKGNLITSPNLIKKLYVDTYVDRLRHREIKPELVDLYHMKNDLWKRRQEILRLKKSPDWTIDDLNKVLKALKNNKSRDPHGFINDIFKPGVIGNNLRNGILYLVNGIKENFFFPAFMQWANVTTIYKSRGSRLCLDSDRGIFVISILKRLIDRMIYNDKYDHIESNMSDSNIGGRRNMNIKNHLFIIHGIINAVIQGDALPIDIQIYDIVKAFDILWLEDCMNDLIDTIPASQQDDKMALLYEGNQHNMVAINTAVGQTERVDIERIVMQGGTWGPIKCSNTIDKIGKICQDTGKHSYIYKNRARILPLGMVDDVLAVSTCGHQSVTLNTFLTTQCEMKKLQFHIPDEQGKTKCHQMHIGKKSVICPTLKIHGYNMEKVLSDKYLGDILCSSGSNSLNLKDRIGKGIGKINEIMSILDTISFGQNYFQILVQLREALFINSVLTNVDIWFGLKDSDITDLEELDRNLLRKVFRTPVTTPKEACHLELGLVPIGSIIKAKRANYFHYLVNRDKEGMLYKFFETMYENPSKEDWTEQAKADLQDFGIKDDFSLLRSVTKTKFKNTVKIKMKEYALDKLNEAKFEHSKMENLVFTELAIQSYLISDELSLSQKRNIFLFRSRMADYSENYRDGTNVVKPCRICKSHSDCQTHSVSCQLTLKSVKARGNYSEIFSNNISSNTSKILEEITEVRKY